MFKISKLIYVLQLTSKISEFYSNSIRLSYLVLQIPPKF